jgi:UDP-glucose 4-epimerase
MRVLVTGASGFLGPQVVNALAQAAHEVYALVRNPMRPPATGTPVVVDLSRPLEPGALPTVDAVVHLAQANVALPEGARELFQVNTAATHELLDWGRNVGVQRFVFASSGTIFGLGEGAVHEDTPRRSDDLYAVTKEMAERLVEAYAPSYRSTVILRPFAPYGPTQQGRVIPRLIDRVREGLPVTLHAGGRPRMTPIFADDAVSAFSAALDLDGHEVVHVAGDEIVSIREVAELIGRVLDREPVFEAGGGLPGDLIADNRRMHDLLGIGPLVPLADGIRATALAGAPA